MKPYGISLGLSEGGIAMRLNRPTAAEDAIWEAVKAAIAQGMTPRQFRIEAAQAWEQELTDEGKDASRELMKD